ncbi:2-keto-4-pentenoate hydratase [Paracraurococcus lichenis]|uniref:Fumarylacetoacetate hydrolase family protein n=1 Tax=Paracraurococcus lichenis TaxID=3064888 RepID=A0ABT9DY69_9PROT|nr:fumarylacetoacetate hydrolase family protein [Paracraurococcus sp. LOR1-02]MDO9708841.1 fumarylacetoacetate hydrolase family protein [Paracraurococcus sp. LOR1-02]
MTDTTQQAADILMAVRQGGPRVAGLGAAAPRDEATAFAIQREVLRRRGARAGGWKCAAPPGKPTSAAMLDAAGIRPGPATWPVPPGEKIGIETEIAFRLGRDLPGRGTPYTLDEIKDAIAACFPAIEMVASRYIDPSGVSPLEAMADSIAHAGLVIGAEVPGWRDMDLKSLTVRQTCGGAVQVEKVGGNPSGDPFTPLLWLANHLPGLGMTLEAGQVVTTGSCTGLLWVDGGQRVTGGFAGLGEVVVDLA